MNNPVVLPIKPENGQSSQTHETPPSMGYQSPNRVGLIIFLLIMLELSMGGLSLWQAVIRAEWRFYALAVSFLCSGLLVLLGAWYFRHGKNATGLFFMMCGSAFSSLAPSVLVSGRGLYLTVGIILLTLIEVPVSQVTFHRTRFIIGGLCASYLAAILNVLDLRIINITKIDLPFIRVTAGAVMILLIIVFTYLLLKKIINLDLQLKLLTAVILLTMAPLAIIVALDSQIPSLVIASVGILSALGAVGMTTYITRPVQELIGTVQKITVGNLDARAVVNTRDEIQVLAQAINHMAGQLQSLINGLEESVQERTLELTQQTHQIGYRATQLQTLSEVARSITSVSDLELLLFSVTRLTSERFNFYHVGIFLIDEASEYAVLRAANSEGGQRMLSRQHRLRIGQTGIVGFVAASGEPRIATDVGKDAVYFNNPDLPETRSEMTLPLKSNGRVIGVIDVQSKIENAFTDDDIRLFGALADQVSIAIDNNRLLTETRQALSDAENIHRKYLHQEWDRELRRKITPAYEYSVKGLSTVKPDDSPEVLQALKTGEICKAPAAHKNGAAAPVQASLAVPVILRGEVIGVIDLQEMENNRDWTQDEINMVKNVADQVGIALENARLFEQTVRRAEREKKVNEITGKIRSTMDPELMLKTAVTELQLALKANQARILLKPKLSPDNSSQDEANSNHRN